MADPAYDILDIGQAADSDAAAAQARDLAALHSELLGHSPLVLMGPGFVEDFYYTVLPAEGYIGGSIAYVDGRAAGFIVTTGDPNGFTSKAMRRHWPRISMILLKTVLRRPGRIAGLIEANRIQSNVKAENYGPEVGELLSFGVLPEYRKRAFVKQSGLSIGADLLGRATAQLAAKGKTRIRAIVDKDNLEAQFFYRGQGWRVGLADVKGWSVPTMEFLVDLPADATNQSE